MTKRVALVCTLLAVAFLGTVDTASACYSRCVRVDGPTTFCRQCMDVGEYTGITCENSGPCGCFFTQNTCGTTLQAESQIEAAPADVCQELPFAEMFAAPAAAD